MYNQGLFYNWVPKILQLLLILIFQFAFLAVNGVYTTNISYMVGQSGNQSDFYMWAYYANSIGMGVAMPLLVRIKSRFRTKEIVSGALVILAFCSYIIGTTTQPYVIVLCSLLMGFVKMFGSIEMLLVLMFILSPDGNRGRFYSVFYPYALVASQLASYWITDISYHLNWQISYMYIAGFCLILAMLSIIFQHNQRFVRKLPLYYVDWLSAMLFSVCFMALAHVFSFGKSQNWFVSDQIKLSFSVFVISAVWMCIRQVTLKRPYLSFKIFERSNVRHGLLMLFFTGLFLGVSALQNTFAVAVLNYDPLTNAKLVLLTLPGMLLAGWFGVYWFNRQYPIKFYVFTGFASYMMYCIYMYFSVSTSFSFDMWILPMFFRGFGMCVLFISVWYYTLDKLNPNDMLAAFGLIIVWRSFVAIGFFTAFFSWLQYALQLQSVNDLAVYLDANTISYSAAMGNLKLTQINAILSSTKIIFGYTIIAGIGVLLYVYFHHFGRVRFTILRFRRLYSGKKGIYRRRKKEEQLRLERQAIEEEIGDSAGAIM